MREKAKCVHVLRPVLWEWSDFCVLFEREKEGSELGDFELVLMSGLILSRCWKVVWFWVGVEKLINGLLSDLFVEVWVGID